MTLDLVPSDEKILPPVPPPVTDTDASTDSTISVGILESYASRVFLEDGLSDYLEKKCWPIGLQKLLVEELKDIRFADLENTIKIADSRIDIPEFELIAPNRLN